MARSVSPAAEAEPGSSPPLPSQMEVDLAAEAGNSSPEEEDIPMADAGDIQPLVEKAEPTTEAPAAQEETDADGDAPVVIEQEKRPEIKLEDLFDGMSSDDEDFPSSSHPQPAQEPPSSQGEPDGTASNTELLRTFYQRFFPWRYMFQWLNHSPTPTNDFKHREFSLWLPNDAVTRYQSYATSELFRQDVLRRMPTRIEIGPVYTANPRDRKTFRSSTAFRPLHKELCFDIDLTDYDDIRTCCDKANICNKCWKFMTMAIKVLDTALREDFGFQHILWVFSGRRGVHAWVCDKQARELDDQMRKAITGYFDVVTGGKQSGKRVNLRRPLHPHLSRTLDTLKESFQTDVLEVQDPWNTPDKVSYILQQIPDAALRTALQTKWSATPNHPSSAKWTDIDLLAQTDASATLDPRELLDAKQDIVLEHTYPRLDVAVSQKLNHLLKSPFVVHPGTGRICVPIDTSSHEAIEAFDPLGVPTLQTLVKDIDVWTEGAAAEEEGGEEEDGEGEGEGVEGRRVQDWEKTSLKPYIDYFRAFVNGLMKEEREIKREAEVTVKREREEEVAAVGAEDSEEDEPLPMQSLEF